MEKNLVCDFCGKTFKREANYLKHKCEKMKRYDLFAKPIGHIAYLTFNQWRKISNRPSVTVENFTSSRYFNAFVEFSKFCKSQSIPDKIGYIELMVKKDLLPFNWCDYDVYDYYIENFDKEYPIDSKIDLSIETIRDISLQYECETSEVFEKVSPIQVIRYVTSRKLSPWLLLTSKKFMDFMILKTNREERVLFSQIIDVTVWKQHLINNAEKVHEIKNINRELGI
jgi:phage FluMu protein Com